MSDEVLGFGVSRGASEWFRVENLSLGVQDLGSKVWGMGIRVDM